MKPFLMDRLELASLPQNRFSPPLSQLSQSAADEQDKCVLCLMASFNESIADSERGAPDTYLSETSFYVMSTAGLDRDEGNLWLRRNELDRHDDS